MSVPQPPKTSASLTNCFFTITFLTRIRRLLGLNAAQKHSKPPELVPEIIDTDMVTRDQDCDGDRSWMAELRRYVKMLHFGSWEEKEAAARGMRKLAEEDVKRRRTMAELGVIPPLVAMVGSEVLARRRLAVCALIELANGSFR